jgi:hypothetical protein
MVGSIILEQLAQSLRGCRFSLTLNLGQVHVWEYSQLILGPTKTHAPSIHLLRLQSLPAPPRCHFQPFIASQQVN